MAVNSRKKAYLQLALLTALAIAVCVLTVRLTVGESSSPADEPRVAPREEPAGAVSAARAVLGSPGEGYQLEQVVVLSRHNIRSPLSGAGSALGSVTPHEWFAWTSNPSELSLRGGALETMMGQYFRQWLEAEGLVPQNWQPGAGETRFYANAKQRTIATAQYFSSGMLPVANVRIETHADYDTMDPVFTPAITFTSADYDEAVHAQIAELYGGGEMSGVGETVAESYALLTDVLDYEDAPGYQSGEYGPLDPADVNVVLEEGSEPAMEGSLKLACQMADALVLQYYEEPDATAAAFGTELSDEQWRQVSAPKDLYGDVLFATPLLATNVAHPLLAEIGSELDAKGRVFSFLCGHDSNVASVLAALDVEPYELPGAIEAATPIGCKLVFERWSDADGKAYGRMRLVYQSVEQLRGLTLLTPDNPPQSCTLTLRGLTYNDDGLCDYDELRTRIQEATDAYDVLVDEYGEEALPAAA